MTALRRSRARRASAPPIAAARGGTSAGDRVIRMRTPSTIDLFMSSVRAWVISCRAGRNSTRELTFDSIAAKPRSTARSRWAEPSSDASTACAGGASGLRWYSALAPSDTNSRARAIRAAPAVGSGPCAGCGMRLTTSSPTTTQPPQATAAPRATSHARSWRRVPLVSVNICNARMIGLNAAPSASGSTRSISGTSEAVTSGRSCRPRWPRSRPGDGG